MAKNLIDGTNIIVEENGNNINMNLSTVYTNNLDQTITDSFKNNNIFSENETVVGKWIDNKPIYRKVISIGNLPNSSTKSVSIGYLSTEVTIVKLEGIAFYSNGITIPLPNVSNVGEEQVKLTINGNGEVAVTTYNDRTGATGYVILEYTKTTD